MSLEEVEQRMCRNLTPSATVDKNAFVDEAIQLCTFLSCHDCKALTVVGVLVPRSQIAVARLPVHTPSTFILVYSYVRKRFGVRGDGSEWLLIRQT